MTRYARAKGSKASNEKLPNEATPWHLMKQQLLEENKKKEPPESKSIKKSVKELVMDKKCSDTVRKYDHDWAEFDDNKGDNLKSKRYMKLTENSRNDDTDHNVKTKNNNTEKLKTTKNGKIKRTDEKNKCSNKRKQHNINDTHSESNNKESSTLQSDRNSNFAVLSKRQKRNLKRKLEKSNYDESERFKKDESNEDFQSKVKETRIKKSGEYKRRKPDTGFQTIIINGVEIEIVKYDGFPVKKEDAERLTKLKQEMLMKGIPQSEVDIALKLERRKAERALARAKKFLCFNCRKSGHVLSDCPELGGKEEAGTGICFKCGSTEHTHFECKVNRDSVYRYAKCFICREQGHISSQCPDNPKGVYPNGGCCKNCGAVTHLKKDCPDLIKIKEDNVVTVEKIDHLAVESL